MPYSCKICTVFRSTFSNWPPLIVFVGTLVMFSGVTFFLGVYVYHTAGILDHDTMTWNKFLSGLDEGRFCPYPAAPTPPATNNNNNQSHTMTLLLQAGAGQELVHNGSVLHEEPAGLNGLNVTVEPVRHSSESGAPLFCIRIVVPSQEDPPVALPSAQLAAPPACDASEPGQGTFQVTEDTSWRRCSYGGGRRLRLKYLPAPEWDLVITRVDQERIYTHLSVTSVFLVVTALCMLMVTAARNRPRYTLTAGDKVPIIDE